MRKFRLTNARGETLDLNNEMMFLYEPSDLGYEKQVSFLRIGNRFVSVDKRVSQLAPSGKMIFAGENPYKDYRKFVRFCGATPLKLIYKPDETEYQMDCILTSIKKEDMEDDNPLLECDVKFGGITFWYQVVEKTITPTPSNIRGWKWDEDTSGTRTWNDDVVGSIIWNSSGETSSIDIESDADEDSPVKLYIYGPCTNPIWYQYVDGELYKSGKINCTIPSDKVLIIDCTGDYPVANIYNSDNTIYQDAYGLRDFSKELFIFLKHGANKISVSNTEGTGTKVKVEGYLTYESV